jgi:hypothetical protein
MRWFLSLPAEEEAGEAEKMKMNMVSFFTCRGRGW